MTLLNLLTVAIPWTTRPYLTPVGAVLYLVLAAAPFTMLFVYDLNLRTGTAIFEELSDQLQWSIVRAKATPKEFPEDTGRTGTQVDGSARDEQLTAETYVPLPIRVALREFAQTSRLPLVPRGNGLLLYAGLNGVLIVLAAVLWYIRTRYI